MDVMGCVKAIKRGGNTRCIIYKVAIFRECHASLLLREVMTAVDFDELIGLSLLKATLHRAKGPFTLGVIPVVYRAVLRTCPISALLFISA